ncbi:caspase activity and apoptosis inhibitor 1-like [Mercenaria mercenaria]|uniref:caspase activity and apoptosis inhibitor 1-like n=1 Tax=Mercenaria mercenaria TaxID=6596 RepID=UPI00234FACBE|nr:caspase activity and apoptosis inhibitor 1-like [Mercenaria mercenaria]XP_053395143.1 caspase activity and apoptosis inhibitor 1-like [Mercenaria mercenaria]XP_053395144.1 caspase activity and apoptosis inhibitor 1-like [Mercenaria mercenaria]XP_053395145.1 caspase activity and apoptosis inhibitor 1-like [Mercenaria mercenaria]XP_053395146.1 caspase activity and apoptosis inhibitor 1-like [Mercenaria mercenaria]XP_053395148.1 caspase activity and apoptosis inhibitor 1-like [Mercenaria merce
MSAAKMVADSTQGDVPEMSSTKKRKKMVQKKKVKKKLKESTKKSKKKSQQEEEFDDSDLDLEKEVYPIGQYVKDRENLLEQMFSCVRGQSLNRALPDVLKELPVADLKRRCLEQLEVMSKKRICRILAGDDPASISSSGTEDESSEDEIQEMEEGQVDEEGMDSQVVDSTSFTHEIGDSDREIDYEEGSDGHSSQSGDQSEEDQAYQQQYGEEYEDADASDVPMEDDTAINQPESECPVTPGTPEEPEEGEVFDDNSESGETAVDNTEKTEIKVSDNVVVNPEAKLRESPEKDADGLGICDNTEESDEKTESEKDKNCAETIKDLETVVGNDKVNTETEDTVDVSEDVDESKIDDSSNKAESTNKIIVISKNVDTDIRIVKTENVENENKLEEKMKEVKGDTDEIEDHIINVEADHLIDEEASNIEAELGAGDNLDDSEISGVEKETEVEKSAPEVVVSEVKKGKPARRIVKPPSQDIAPALTRNQMELLELEMRARAIKAMLKTAK